MIPIDLIGKCTTIARRAPPVTSPYPGHQAALAVGAATDDGVRKGAALVPSSPDSVAPVRPATTRPHRSSGPGAADLAAVAAGGGLGSIARYLLSQAFPADHGFPWAIFAINVSGCFLLGLLMIYLLDVWPPRRFLRPFLAIGVLGGYTTFSTYAAGVMTLLTGRAPALADAYALSSILAGLVAVWGGMKGGRVAATRPGWSGSGGGSR
jgi:fluoride exporter